jgi:hypothetical protein
MKNKNKMIKKKDIYIKTYGREKEKKKKNIKKKKMFIKKKDCS